MSVAMHNLHGKKFGKTPRELLRDSPASKENPVSAMFCSQVLAETPESVKSIGRFVTAAYLWPVRNSFAHFVVAKIEGELKYFQAKSLKLVLPLHFPDELIQRFVVSTQLLTDGSAAIDPAVGQFWHELIGDSPPRLSTEIQRAAYAILWMGLRGEREGLP